MSGTSSSAAAFQPLPLAVRGDLMARRQTFQGRTWWVIKDPLKLRYHRLAEAEYFILNNLDGQHSPADIQEAYGWQFAPDRLSIAEVVGFAAMLHQSGLVTSHASGQGHVMLERDAQRIRGNRWGMLSNLLSIRFRGVDPDGFLNRVYPFVRWAFTPAALWMSLLLGLAALLLVVVRMETFYAKLPAFHQFFTRENAFTLAGVLVVTKICHELGHAFACKHFGGECHEIGVLLLVFSPCLYCNVSDSWMLPNKWHRMAIAAAGMYVELVIASLATFAWWFSQPGLLHNLCLSTMFICSVTTVLFNANPLLRYDGYYILADYLEIPNLRQRSSDMLRRFLSAWFLGDESSDDPFLPRGRPWQFALFTVASEIYRWLVTLSILVFLYHCLEPYRLKILGQLLGCLSLFALLIQPVSRLVRFMRTPRKRDEYRQRRFFIRSGSLAFVAVVLLAIPLPHRVHCPLALQPRDAASVFVKIPGEITELRVRPGQVVAAGETLAQLENIDLELEAATIRRKRDRQRVLLENARRIRFLDEKAAGQLPELAKSVASLSGQLDRKQADLDQLTLAAPLSGTVLPPPSQSKSRAADGELPTWSGTPLERRNMHCSLSPGSLLCQIGDPSRFWADLVIDQADIEYVQLEQSVVLLFDELPGVVFRGTVEEIARRDLQATPQQLSNKTGGNLASKSDAGGRERPMNASFQARVAIDDPEQHLRIGCRGRASIHVSSQSLGQAAWRWWQRTFHFKL
ncbi:MAG: HlyD family efflux transporter periplasmic adaptor subunit [Pirellulales bacterium]